MKLLRPEEYYGEEIRIGKILNPHFVREYGSVYSRVCNSSKEGVSVSERLWNTWKKGRNLVFHYFPHNFRRLSFVEAKEIIEEIVDSMNFAVTTCKLPPHHAESVESLN